MSLQTYFKEFNKVIKMDYDVKSELKEKRDILLGILRNDDDMPAFDEYNQGSDVFISRVSLLKINGASFSFKSFIDA